jgi:hypothetical protein
LAQRPVLIAGRGLTSCLVASNSISIGFIYSFSRRARTERSCCSSSWGRLIFASKSDGGNTHYSPGFFHTARVSRGVYCRSCYPPNHEFFGTASADLCLQNRGFRDGPGWH